MGLLRDTISNFCVFVHMNPVSTHEFSVELEEKLRILPLPNPSLKGRELGDEAGSGAARLVDAPKALRFREDKVEAELNRK